MTANVIWIAAIIQRPVIRLRTSRSARRRDSSENRSRGRRSAPSSCRAGSPRPRATPARSRRHRRARPGARRVTFLRWSPTRFVSQTKSGSRIRAKSGEAPVEQHHRDDRRDHGGHVREHRGRGRRDDGVDAADVVRDPALHVAGARAGEEGEREPLQVLVDRRAQVVHHRLADAVREQRLVDADRAGDDRDQRSSRRRGPSAGARRSRGAPCRGRP